MLAPAPCSSLSHQCHQAPCAVLSPGGERGDGGRFRASRDRALCVLPGEDGSREGSRGALAGLGPHGRDTQSVQAGDRASAAHGGTQGGVLLHQESHRGRSTGDRRWQSHPTTSGRHRGPSRYLQQQEQPAAGSGNGAGGKGEPGEREETQLLLRGSCCPSVSRSKRGQCKPAPLRATKHREPPNTLPILQHPPVSPWNSDPGWAVIFLQGCM